MLYSRWMSPPIDDKMEANVYAFILSCSIVVTAEHAFSFFLDQPYYWCFIELLCFSFMVFVFCPVN